MNPFRCEEQLQQSGNSSAALETTTLGQFLAPLPAHAHTWTTRTPSGHRETGVCGPRDLLPVRLRRLLVCPDVIGGKLAGVTVVRSNGESHIQGNMVSTPGPDSVPPGAPKTLPLSLTCTHFIW